MAVSYMTEDGYNKILAEINYLETVKRPEISARLLKPGIKVTCLKMQNMTLQRRLKALWKQNWPS